MLNKFNTQIPNARCASVYSTRHWRSFLVFYTRYLGRLWMLAALVLPSCSDKPMRTTVKAAPAVEVVELMGRVGYRSVVAHPDALGVSGSCHDGSNTWLVAERNNRLLRIDPDSNVMSFKLEGIPDGIDLEGLACKDGRFYMSTESQVDHRTGDLVLVVDLEGSAGKVVEVITMHYPDGMEANANQGLEGLCIAGDWLVAAGEILQKDSAGTRQAPILRKKIGGDNTFLHWVNLTSDTGKISGIDCRIRNDRIEVFAIERHFEVCRLLQFELSEEASKAKRVVELAHITREGDNYESLLVDDEGYARLSNDNQYIQITGATEETFLAPIRGFAR